MQRVDLDCLPDGAGIDAPSRASCHSCRSRGASFGRHITDRLVVVATTVRGEVGQRVQCREHGGSVGPDLEGPGYLLGQYGISPDATGTADTRRCSRRGVGAGEGAGGGVHASSQADGGKTSSRAVIPRQQWR